MLMASATAGLRRSSTPTASRIRASRPTSCASSASKAATRTSTARCWLATAAGGRSTRRDREPEQRGAACDPHAGPLPERPGGDEADLLDAARCRVEVAGAADVLARRAHRVREPLRRALRDGGVVSCGAVFSLPCGAVRRRRAPARSLGRTTSSLRQAREVTRRAEREPGSHVSIRNVRLQESADRVRFCRRVAQTRNS